MKIIERGHGDPLVLIPGLQGRWEYARQTVDALAGTFRVVTFSLGDEPSAAWPFDRRRGIDAFADHVAAALDDRGIPRAVICGVSFGGLVALRFAAREPDRTSALIMVSTPGPQWHLKPRHDLYARLPRLFGPVFFAESPWRLKAEIAMALPDRRARWRFARSQARTIVRAPLSVTRMASRARMVASYDRVADCAAVVCPTLIVHGDPTLDHVVDAGGTLDYVTRIRGARAAVLPQTGHLGSVTRPDEFVALVHQFLHTHRQGSHDSAA
jgi:pimeloyl-ACP methyl ester carboxylesterase